MIILGDSIQYWNKDEYILLQGLGFRQWHKDYDEFEERRSELNCFQSKWNLIFVKKVNKREKESHQRRNFKETSVDTSPLINVRPQIYFYFSIVSSLNTVLRNQIFRYVLYSLIWNRCILFYNYILTAKSDTAVK